MQSLLDFLAQYNANGEEVALRCRRGYRMEPWTYAGIVQQANRMARELECRGVGKADTVLLWGKNTAEWIVVFFGCLLRGAVVVPLDDGSTVDFASRVAKEVNAKLICRSATLQHPEPGTPCVILESLLALLARHSPRAYPASPLSRQDTLEIIFTSGTTAEPRGVVISHGNVLANIEPLQREIGKYLRYERLVHPLRFLNLLPLSHVFGQMLGIFIPPLLTGVVIFTDSHKPSELVELIRRQHVSVLVAVPRFIDSLRREVERVVEQEGRGEKFAKDCRIAAKEHFLWRWWRFRRIRSRLGWKFWAFICGGAALSESTESFWNSLGYAVIQGYGMTETTSLVSLNHPFRSTKGSLGQVFPGMEVRVDENGEILVRGENVATAYQQNDHRKPTVETDGWFHTGDLAERDASGRLYFKGRRKNVVVTPAGMNIYPGDLEAAVRRQPGVRDCVVIGIDYGGNQEAVAVLLLEDSQASAASVVERANRSLAEYQKIRRWLQWPEADFPRTATQKPVLSRIREVASGEVAASAAEQGSKGALANLIRQITGNSIGADPANPALERDLQMSSLDRVELMSALEDRYQTDLSDVGFAEAATVGQLAELVGKPRPGTAAHVYQCWPQNWLITALRLAVYYLLAWPATYLLAAPRVRGRQHLQGLRGPALIIANHVTYLDIAWILPALPARFRNRMATAMGGERLARMRRPPKEMAFFRRMLERLDYFLALSLFNVFPLPQQSGFLKSFSFAGDLADRGWNILVFPEGQTRADGKMVPFRSGIGLLAKQLNLPVIPVRLSGLSELKKTGRILARPGQVQVNIGEPVHFSASRDPEQITRELERRVAAL